jgi:hypothetical protein
MPVHCPAYAVQFSLLEHVWLPSTIQSQPSAIHIGVILGPPTGFRIGLAPSLVENTACFMYGRSIRHPLLEASNGAVRTAQSGVSKRFLDPAVRCRDQELAGSAMYFVRGTESNLQ